jgi:nickel transport protein
MTLPLLLIMLGSLPVHAHKVRIFAWEESGIVNTEVKFSGGRPAKNAQISVTSVQDKQELLTGTTDSEGLFSFPVPDAAKTNQYNLEITVNSGDGHKNSWLLNAADYLQVTGKTPRQQPESPSPSPLQAAKQVPPEQQNSTVVVIDQEQLSQIIESALDRKLGPIKRSLAEQQNNKPSLQNILGGIGYILGLAGIAAYFKSQNKQ